MSKQTWTDSDLMDVEHHAEKRGAAKERERIIALLEEEHGAHPVGWDYTDWLIALIKGEKP